MEQQKEKKEIKEAEEKKKSKYSEKKLREKIDSFSEQGWELVTNLVTFGDPENFLKERKTKRSKNYGDFDFLLSSFFSEIILCFIMDSWNAEMEKVKQTGEGTKSGELLSESTIRSLVNFRNIGEVKQMIGCLILMIRTEKHKQTEAWAEVKKHFPKGSFVSWNKIENVIHFLRFTDEGFKKFAIKLSTNLQSLLNCGDIIAADESIIPDFTRNIRSKKFNKNFKGTGLNKKASDDSAPLTDIPNKPHPHGILIYGLCSKTEKHKLPIFWEMEIIFNPSERSAIKALLRMVDKWPKNKPKPNLIADAAFCTFQSVAELSQRGWKVLMSMNRKFSGSAGFLITTLNCENGVISIYHNPGLVMSIRRNNSEEQKKRIQILLTNDCYQVETKSLPLIDENLTENEDFVSMRGVDKKLDGDYEKEDLNQLSLKELKKIAEKLEIPSRGNKKEVVKKVWKGLSSEEYMNQYTILENSIKNIAPRKTSHLHETYRENFNAEDKFNREWLSSLPEYITRSWRHKLSISLILLHLLNAYAVFSEYNQDQFITKNNFLEKAGLWFIK